MCAHVCNGGREKRSAHTHCTVLSSPHPQPRTRGLCLGCPALTFMSWKLTSVSPPNLLVPHLPEAVPSKPWREEPSGFRLHPEPTERCPGLTAGPLLASHPHHTQAGTVLTIFQLRRRGEGTDPQPAVSQWQSSSRNPRHSASRPLGCESASSWP